MLFKKKKRVISIAFHFFLILTCSHGGQKNYPLHMKAEICTEYHDLESQGLMKNFQISSKWCAASVAVSISSQSHMHQCGSLSRTTDIAGWLPAGFCKQYLKSSIWNKKTP